MKTIGKYQVADEIGRSAAGVTCRARDPFRNRDFALKILSPLAALTAAAKDQLYRDLAASWELTHRHIAKVHDIGELEGGVYIATELLAGTGLTNFLAAQQLSIGEKLALMAQVAEALAAAHSAGLAHGNIKPSNIFVTEAGTAAVLDFGIGTWQSLLLAAGVRLNGLVPNYMAPEQILGEPFDSRSDIFSLGVVLYESLRGQHPFAAPAAVIPREIMHSEPEPLRKWNPHLPAELEEILIRALKKDPRERIQTADELAANLFVLAQHTRNEPSVDRAMPSVEPTTPKQADPPQDEPAQVVSPQSVEVLAQGVAEAVPVCNTPVPATPPEASPTVPAALVAVETTLPEEPSVPAPAVEISAMPLSAAAETAVPAAPFTTPEPDRAPEPVPSIEYVETATAFAPPPIVTAPLPIEAAPASVPMSIQPLQVPPAPVQTPSPMPVAQPRPQLRPTPAVPARAAARRPSRRLVTFAIGGVMALSMIAVIVVRQNQAAPNASQEHAAAPVSPAQQAPAEPIAPEKSKPAPFVAPPPAAVTQAGAPTPVKPAQEPAGSPAAEKILLNEAKTLWESGQYAPAMRLVDDVLAQNPASAEAREWKKKIRAAQEAEAAVK